MPKKQGSRQQSSRVLYSTQAESDLSSAQTGCFLGPYSTPMGYLLRAGAKANNYNANMKGNKVECKARLNKMTHHLLLLRQ